MTARHLRRLFLRHAGASPTAVATTRRVQRAKALVDARRCRCRRSPSRPGSRASGGSTPRFARSTAAPPTAVRRAPSRGAPRRCRVTSVVALFRREEPDHGKGHADRGDEHRAGRRGRVPRLVRHRAPAGAAARSGLSRVRALDRRGRPQNLGRDLRPRERRGAAEPGLSGDRRREPVAVVEARHRPGRAPDALRGRPDPAGRPAAARPMRAGCCSTR